MSTRFSQAAVHQQIMFTAANFKNGMHFIGIHVTNEIGIHETND